jgi:hypothetical protein
LTGVFFTAVAILSIVSTDSAKSFVIVSTFDSSDLIFSSFSASFSSNDFVLGYWLENPYSAISLGAWSVNSKGRLIDNSRSVNNSNGVGTRPVIEVPKSKILY